MTKVEHDKTRRQLRRILGKYRQEDYYPKEMSAPGRRAKRSKRFHRDDFLAICNLKSTRPQSRYKDNHRRTVSAVTGRALASRHERVRMRTLQRLQGVGIPVASALLCAVDPDNYGIIDVRVWRTLYWLRLADENPEGRGLSMRHWLQYLGVLRYWASVFEVPVRRLEYSLFLFHKDFLQGDTTLEDPRMSGTKRMPRKLPRQLRWLAGSPG